MSHLHRPVQHRDGKPPWCRTCGLTAAGNTPHVTLTCTCGVVITAVTYKLARIRWLNHQPDQPGPCTIQTNDTPG